MKKLVAAVLLGMGLLSTVNVSSVAALGLTRDDVRSMSDLRMVVPYLQGEELREFYKLAVSYVGPAHHWQTVSGHHPGQSFLTVTTSKCFLAHETRSYEVDSEYGTFQDLNVTPIAFAYNRKFSRGYMLTLQGSAGQLVGTRFVGGAGRFKQAAGPHDGFNRTSRGFKRIYVN